MLNKFLKKNLKIKRNADMPAPPKQYFYNFVAIKYLDTNKQWQRRVMYGSLCKGINIDLTAFNMEELEAIIQYEIFPLLEEGHDLKVYRGLNHVRVWKNKHQSGHENYLFIGDTPISE